MTDLSELLAAARDAPPNDRIPLYRNPIASFGPSAITALIPWLADGLLAGFAIRTIQQVGQNGAREAAMAALRTTPRTMPPTVLHDADAALLALGDTGGLGGGVDPQLRDYLVSAARRSELVTYTQAASVVGLSMRNPNHRNKVIGDMLRAISEAEVLAGRPMLSSIVVAKGGGVHLGAGFAVLAEQLGLKPAGMDPDEFARQEVERTFAYWKSH